MPKRQPYTCPRCGYVAQQKGHMRKHLFTLQKQCPATQNVIELTEEIKEHILNNRVYHPPKQSAQQVIINQINNNQQIINYIDKIDTKQKLETYIAHTNTELLPLEDKIKEHYQDDIEKCETMDTKLIDFSLGTHDIMNIINTLTTPSGIDKLNVVYDKTPDKLWMYDDGDWENYAFEHGVNELIEKVQSTYLNKYEELLLDKYDHDKNFQERKRAEERLKEYYEFLVAFEIKPLLVTSERKDILDYNSKYYSIYDKVLNKITFSHAKQIQKSVYHMVKTNCNSSIGELNRKMMDIICTDEDFKTKVLQMLQVST